MSEHSSPSFGSQQKCSMAQLIFYSVYDDTNNKSICLYKYKHNIPSWPVMQCKLRLTFTVLINKNKAGVLLLSLRRMYAFCNNATTYTPVELLGPCFKTGRTVVSV